MSEVSDNNLAIFTMHVLKKTIRWLSRVYLFVILCLFLYSFTQVDLDLTLSRASWFQTIEKSFQYIGYFNRPLSSWLYIFLLIVLFGLWLFFCRLAVQQKITRVQI